MTVSTAYVALVYAGNGVTTDFPVTWPFFSGGLIVTAISATGVRSLRFITTNYTVSGGTAANGLPGTGTLSMNVPPASGTFIEITRHTARTQTATFTNNDAFPAKTVETAYDKAVLQMQETHDEAHRALRLDPDDYNAGLISPILPAVVADNYLKVNADGDGFEFGPGLPGPTGDTGPPGATGPAGSPGPSYGGSSTTSLTVGTGSKSLTTQSGLAWQVDNAIRLQSGTAWMEGQVTAYSGTALTVNVTLTNGSGTLAAWVLGPVGGAPGAGAVTSVNGAVGTVQIPVPIDTDMVIVNGREIAPFLLDFAGRMVFGADIGTGDPYGPSFNELNKLKLFVWDVPDMEQNYIPLQLHGGGALEIYDKDENVRIPALPSIPTQAQTLDARSGSPITLTQWNGIVGNFQSNSSGVGYTSVVSATAFYPSNAITFTNGPRPDDTAGSFTGTQALYETTENGSQQGTPTTNAGESPCTGFAFRFIEDGVRDLNWTLSGAPVLFVSTAGVGGAGIDNFIATGTFWSRFQAHVTNQKARATAASKTFNIPAVFIWGGESDCDADTKSRATYLTKLNTFHSDMNTYVKAQTGQANDIVTVGVQINYGARRPNNPGAVALGYYDWHNGQDHVLAGPTYPYTWNDQFHPNALGRRLVGEIMGRAAKVALVDHRKWTGLRPRAVWAKGAEVYVRFYVPSGPLCFDTVHVPPVKDYGFKVTDGGGTKTISRVHPVSADTIKITCSTAVSGTVSVRYALDYLYDNPVMDPTYGAAGNLRDSDRTRVVYAGANYYLWNWALAFDLTADVLQATVS